MNKTEPLEYLQYQPAPKPTPTFNQHTQTHTHIISSVRQQQKNIIFAVLVYTWQTIINKRYNTTRKSLAWGREARETRENRVRTYCNSGCKCVFKCEKFHFSLGMVNISLFNNSYLPLLSHYSRFVFTATCDSHWQTRFYLIRWYRIRVNVWQ